MPCAAREEAEAIRRKLGIPRGKTVVGIVGRLQPWKGQDRFIRAIDELRRRGHDVHGLVVGGNAWDLSPGYEPYLHELVEELDLTSAIDFTGQVANVAAYLRTMDVFVSASEPEPFGIALLEAMALGVPVVAVNAGGPAEIIESGASGILTASGAPNVLANALDPLLSDEKSRNRLGEGGRRRFLKQFTAEQMAISLEESFEDLLK
jgi:glycosyltransferase involved in cell wall biosynthesis